MIALRLIAFGLGLVAASVLGFLIAGDSIRGVTSTQDHEPTIAARWGTTAVGPIPAGLGLEVAVDAPRREGEQHTLRVFAPTEGKDAPTLVISAATGEIIGDTLSELDSALTAEVTKTIRVNLGTPEVWPFADGQPATISRFAGIEFGVPDPEAGISVINLLSYCATDACPPRSLRFVSSRSSVLLDASDGSIEERSIDPAEADAFERLLSSVHVGAAIPAPGDGGQ